MESSTKHALRRGAAFSRLRAARQGKITLVTCVAILGLIVLAGFVGNAGHVVTAKVSTQNAADAIAFSSAQWMARGMNSVTATNHLVGEVTALVVILEGLGGPEADEGMEDYPLEMESVDKINQKLGGGGSPPAAIRGGYGASAFTSADTQFLKLVIRLVSPEDRNKAKNKAFATIYDSKRILKRKLRKELIIKTVANAGFYVPPPFGWGTMAIAYGLHLTSNVAIAGIAKEYLILEGFEILVTKLKPFKVGILEDKLIPALEKHGDLLAGRAVNTGPVRTSVVNAGIVDTFDRLGKFYDVEAAIYPTATLWTLPIEREPEASTNRGSRGQNEPEWGNDTPPAESTEDLLGDLRESISDQKENIDDRIGELGLETGPELPDFGPINNDNNSTNLERQLDDLLDADPSPALREQILAEQKKQQELRKAKQDRIRELAEQKRALDREYDKMAALVRSAGDLAGQPANLSVKNIPQQYMNQKEERYTQWVRATYPYVDAFRAPIMKKFEEELERCEAADHYKKWTNRYTLVKAWQFRSGFRFEGKKGTNQPGIWKKDPASARSKPLTLYVMKGAYPEKRPGSRDKKGFEKWTLDTTEGKQEAEEIFTIIGMTHHKLEPLFSPVLYSDPTENGITTFAQAVFYNGNKQTPRDPQVKSKFQPVLGWDTLNWTPGKNVPEWAADPVTSTEVDKWPWTVFKGAENQRDPANVTLNWQAKLMPVTQSRYMKATGGGVTKPEILENMIKGIPYFNALVHH